MECGIRAHLQKKRQHPPPLPELSDDVTGDGLVGFDFQGNIAELAHVRETVCVCSTQVMGHGLEKRMAWQVSGLLPPSVPSVAMMALAWLVGSSGTSWRAPFLPSCHIFLSRPFLGSFDTDLLTALISCCCSIDNKLFNHTMCYLA